MLDLVLGATASWPNRVSFTFHVIQDRSDLPSYFASTDA